MSQEIVKTELEGFSGPHTHRLLCALNKAWDSSKDRIPDVVLSLLEKIPEFSKLRRYGVYTTKDGYHWFLGALFSYGDPQNQLLILFPYSLAKGKGDLSLIHI